MSIADQPTVVPSPTPNSAPSDVPTTVDGDGPALADRPLARGSVLGRYVVLDELGAGAMGRVYAAYDPRLDRKVALKLIRGHPAFSAAPQRAQRQLLREAQSLARLAHPNVVTVHDVEVVDGMVALAMEFVTGKSLRAWMAGDHGWSATVAVLREAAQGLAAAHRAGVIHRDFKPDNVMVGDDARARVVDFGLARADAPSSDGLVAVVEDEGASIDASRTIGVAGTPAYMAPELLAGGAADARSDQFSFCVALYEALYGRRPFAGNSLASMSANVVAGRVLAPDRGSDVPTWLYRIALRGLAPDPAARWPDMDVLAEQLARDPSAARRRWLVLAGAATAIAAVVGVAISGRASPCASDAGLATMWDDDVRAQVRASMLATGAPWAERAVEQAEAVLDRQLTALVDMTRDNCEATRVRGEQSEAILDLRAGCLATRRRELAAVTKSLRNADADVVRESTRILAGLSSVEPCADVEALRELVPLPADPGQRARIDELRTALAEIDVATRAGKYADAIAAARPILADARELGYAPLEAEAGYAVGYLEDKLAQYAASEATLSAAALLAARLRDDRLATRAMSDVVYVVGSELGRIDEAMIWARHAEVVSERAGDPLLRAKFLNTRALVHETAGRFVDAERDLREAVALRERELGPDNDDVATSLGNLAISVEAQGRTAESIAIYRDALARNERLLGPEHPRTATTLINLADALNNMNRYEEALALARRAETILRATMPADHPHLGAAVGLVGASLWNLGDLEGARAAIEDSLRIQRSRFGPDHHEVALVEHNLGAIHYQRGDLIAAREHFERSLQIYDKVFGPGHPESASSLNSLGLLDLLGDDPQAALIHYGRARDLLASADLLAREEGAQAVRGVAKAELALGRPRQAVVELERAIELFAAAPQLHVHVAGTRLWLARALWLDGQRERAITMLAEARRAATSDNQETLARIAAHERGFAIGELPPPQWD